MTGIVTNDDFLNTVGHPSAGLTGIIGNSHIFGVAISNLHRSFHLQYWMSGRVHREFLCG